jgi:hypothetical protein
MTDDVMREEPRELFWISMEHSCGCAIDSGCDSRQRDEFTSKFLPAAAPHPCPMHGSASGKVEPALAAGEKRYLVACNAWYRLAPDDQLEAAKKNREIALSFARAR